MAFTLIDLIAATTNALNGGLLARRPTHYRHYTVVGIVLLAILAGIVGGVIRDVILVDVPAALANPWYLLLTTLAGLVAVCVPHAFGQRFRDGAFQFAAAFALPWYAAAGAEKALQAGLPGLAAVVLGVVGATAGRCLVDMTSGVTPKPFVRGEWFVGTAVLASAVYVVGHNQGLPLLPATLVAFGIAFTFRLLALLRGWEEPEPWAPPEVAAGEVARKTLREQLHAPPAAQPHPTP